VVMIGQPILGEDTFYGDNNIFAKGDNVKINIRVLLMYSWSDITYKTVHSELSCVIEFKWAQFSIRAEGGQP